MADDKDTAPKKLSSTEFAQKRTEEALARLAAAAAAKEAEAAAEVEKPAAAEEEDEKPLDFFLANFVNCAIKDEGPCCCF